MFIHTRQWRVGDAHLYASHTFRLQSFSLSLSQGWIYQQPKTNKTEQQKKSKTHLLQGALTLTHMIPHALNWIALGIASLIPDLIANFSCTGTRLQNVWEASVLQGTIIKDCSILLSRTQWVDERDCVWKAYAGYGQEAQEKEGDLCNLTITLL